MEKGARMVAKDAGRVRKTCMIDGSCGRCAFRGARLGDETRLHADNGFLIGEKCSKTLTHFAELRYA